MKAAKGRRRARRLFPGWCLMLGILLLAGCSIPEGGFSWKLRGFEVHSFTVDGEEIDMRLDTSGFGRYEVELLEDGTIRTTRDGSVVLEGFFISAEECMDWMTQAQADPDCAVIQYTPGEVPVCMLYYYETEEEAGYVLLSMIDGSGLGAAFAVLDGDTDEAALDCAQRLQFTKRV